MSESLWYFAYGSNMSRAIFVQRRGIQPSETNWGWLDGYRLCFDLPIGPGERGVANVVADETSRTCGVLYRITVLDADRLDRTEGVHVGYYQRLPIVVACADSVIEAFTYRSPHGVEGRKPSPRYMGLLLDGAREHRLPESYVEYLSGFTLARDERNEVTS